MKRRWRCGNWSPRRESDNSYSFDSGFALHPGRYIVGYFSSPYLEKPAGAVPFGPVEDK